MNEEGDVPTVSEAFQSSPMESPNEELAPKTDKPQQELTDSRKTTQSTRLIRRLGSLTGITKSKAKVATESTEEIVALQIKVSQLTKELEESRSEIDRCKRESGDVSERAKRESDEIRAEFDRYKLESQFEKNSLMTKMDNDDKLKTAEIEMLKIANLKTEAERETLITKMECDAKLKSTEIDNLKKKLEVATASAERESANLNGKLEENRIEIDRYKRESDEKASLFAQLESEVKLMSAEIGNLKVAHLKTEAERDSLITKMECDAKLKSAEIDNLKRESLEKASLFTKLESEVKLMSAEMENLKIALRNTESERDSLISKMECESKLKLEEIENLKVTLRKTEGESKSRIAELEGKLKLKSAENFKMAGCVLRSLANVEENLSSLLNRTNEMTIRARFVVSELTEENTYSQCTEFAGMNWRIRLYKKDDHLGFHLEGIKENATKWSCSVLSEFQLISQKSKDIIHIYISKKADLYNEEHYRWGRPKFIPFKDLFDEEKGYVKNDSIIVAVAFKAFPAN